MRLNISSLHEPTSFPSVLFDSLTTNYTHHQDIFEPENELQERNQELEYELQSLLQIYTPRLIPEIKNHLGTYAGELATSLSTFLSQNKSFPKTSQPTSASDFLDHYDHVSNYFLENIVHRTKNITHPLLTELCQHIPLHLQPLYLTQINNLFSSGFNVKQVQSFVTPPIKRYEQLSSSTPPSSIYQKSFQKTLEVALNAAS